MTELNRCLFCGSKAIIFLDVCQDGDIIIEIQCEDYFNKGFGCCQKAISPINDVLRYKYERKLDDLNDFVEMLKSRWNKYNATI